MHLCIFTSKNQFSPTRDCLFWITGANISQYSTIFHRKHEIMPIPLHQWKVTLSAKFGHYPFPKLRRQIQYLAVHKCDKNIDRLIWAVYGSTSASAASAAPAAWAASTQFANLSFKQEKSQIFLLYFHNFYFECKASKL